MAYPMLGAPSVPTQPGQMGSPYPSPYGQSPYGQSPSGLSGQRPTAAPVSPYGPSGMPPGFSPMTGWMGRAVGLSGNLGMASPPGMSAMPGMPDAHANLAAAQAQTLRRPTYFQARPGPMAWGVQTAPMGPNPWSGGRPTMAPIGPNPWSGGRPTMAPMPTLSTALRGF